jgi:hypothetical protein
MLNSNKMLFLYFNLCLIVEFDSVSCSFITISVLTYSDDYDKQYDDILNLSKNNKGILYCTSLSFTLFYLQFTEEVWRFIWWQIRSCKDTSTTRKLKIPFTFQEDVCNQTRKEKAAITRGIETICRTILSEG